MASKQEIEKLKSQWDGTWDIETEEGFEEHAKELLEYRLQMERIWEKERTQKLMDKAREIGCPGNLRLANYVTKLEKQIEKLEEKLERIEL